MKWWLWLAGVLFAFGWTQPVQAQQKSWKQICQLYKKGAVLVDVRTAGEVKANPVKGALHIPLSRIQTNPTIVKQTLKAHKLLKKPILFFCHSGGRSGLATMIAKGAGYKKVYNAGGYKVWQKIKPRKKVVCK